MEKKYRLLKNDTITVDGRTLYRIEALKDFANMEKGDKGGYVESEENLSQEDGCWVYDEAVVYNNARVCDDAKVYGKAEVYDDAWVYGKAEVYGKAKVCDDAKVYNNARVCDDAKVYGKAEVYGEARVWGKAEVCDDAKVRDTADYYVGKNIWSSGRYFTYTRSNKMWTVGCFYGTGEELIRKAYQDSDVSGREYKRVVEYVETMYADLENDKNK